MRAAEWLTSPASWRGGSLEDQWWCHWSADFGPLGQVIVPWEHKLWGVAETEGKDATLALFLLVVYICVVRAAGTCRKQPGVDITWLDGVCVCVCEGAVCVFCWHYQLAECSESRQCHHFPGRPILGILVSFPAILLPLPPSFCLRWWVMCQLSLELLVHYKKSQNQFL